MRINLHSLKEVRGPYNNVYGKWIEFSGGEQHIQLDCERLRYTGALEILARLRSGNDLMKLCMLVDAARSNDLEIYSITIPYFPYGRQDRIVNEGEAFGVRAFADIINSFNVKIITLDNHSPVTGAVVRKNVEILPDEKLGSWICELLGKEKVVFLSPDEGAVKRTKNLVKEYLEHWPTGKVEMKMCFKSRDLKTGEILGIEVPEIDEDAHVIVRDDICDGGRTFLELAKAVNLKGRPASMNLFVSHGIFSKGVNELKQYFDRIITTDSFYSAAEYKEKFVNKVEVLKIWE